MNIEWQEFCEPGDWEALRQVKLNDISMDRKEPKMNTELRKRLRDSAIAALIGVLCAIIVCVVLAMVIA